MNERALQTVYWPDITLDINRLRQGCDNCDKYAPSQPALPPCPLASPDYPFQMISADYFDVKGKTWLVIVDRFSGWLSIFYYYREATSRDLINKLKEFFTTFGVAEEFSSDEGPQFRSRELQQFFSDWGVRQRVSSAYFPHSNLRAETAVKSAKRLIRDNTRTDGSPNWDKIYRALLNHRNTRDTEWKLSPAELIFGRPVRDFLPIKLNQYNPSEVEVWITDRISRESALRHRVHLGREKWSLKTKDLAELKPGQHVLIQNQKGQGKIAKQWDRTGIVVEDLGHRKYRVRTDGSGRVTDRNRQFLRQFKPATFRQPGSQFHGDGDNRQQTPSIMIPGHIAEREYDPQGGQERDYIPVPTHGNVNTEESETQLSLPDVRTDIDTEQATQNSSRRNIPLALRQLADYNIPGDKEETLEPSDERVTRSNRRRLQHDQ